jgi:hypothetical protein
LKRKGLNEEAISQSIEIIKDIYIGQNIRGDGILQSDFDKFDIKPIASLLKCNYIKRDRCYGLHLYCTTEKGSKIGEIEVTNLIDKNKEEMEEFLNEQPQKVLNFIIREQSLKERSWKFIYPVVASDILDFNWKDCLRKSNKLHRVWTSVLMKLEELGLCIRTHSFVTTGGGELREENYVISPEVFEFLVELCPQEAFTSTDKDYENLKLYGVLSHFTYWSDYPRDILREKLIDAELEKTKVKEIIDRMAELGITSEYRGFSSEAPFSIKDEIRYESWLEKNLIEPVIGALLEQPKIGEEKDIAIKKEEKEVVKDITDVKGVIKPPIPPLSDLKIFLGEDENKKEIFWEPKKEINWSFVIVGSAGTGKTQTVKAVLSEFAKCGLPYIIFDFRNDYITKAKESEFGQILDLSTISINPLELDGNNTPKDQKYQISDIVDLVYNIGERQVGHIRSAIKHSYEDKGIKEEDEDSWRNVPPTFDDIQNNLVRLSEEGDSGTRSSIKGIFARLDPIFDYGIFSAETVMPFEEIMKGQTLVNLGTLPNDNLKAVVCEFFMRKLRYYLDKIGESRDPRLYVIIDEAHRLKYEREASAGQLLKEARKYGVGMLLATQDPVDFTDVVYNNIGGIMSLQLTDPKYAKTIAEHLGGKVKWQNVKNDLSSKFSAYAKFSQHPAAIRFDVIPHYKR